MSTILSAGTATTGAVLSSDTAGTLQIQTGSTPTTAITVDASQNVGVGTTSPTPYATEKVLDIYGSGTSSSVRVRNSGGTGGAMLYTLNADAYLWNVNNSFLSFGTNNGERMRIDSSGNLLVGTTSAFDNVSYLKVQSLGGVATKIAGTSLTSQMSFFNDNGRVGYIGTSGTTTSYNTSSDYRLKDNIQPMTGALATVAQLKPVTYKWKADGSNGQGFIAHELQAVVPECVTGEKDAIDAEGKPVYQGIDTSFLVATLTAAIQEQQTMITQLKAEIDELKAKVAA